MKRLEGVAKLTGRERYIDDLDLGDHLWGATVRSPSPRGRIREVRFADDVDWSEFTIVDHTDIPGQNTVFVLEGDQPVLAAGETRHIHEPVLLLAHHSRDAVRRAAKKIEIVVDAEEPVFDFRVPPTPAQVQRGDDNVLKRLRIEKGDVEAALAGAHQVVEGTYETGAQEHVYLETQGMAAWVEDGVVTVQGSMQCPYYIVNAAERALGLDRDHLRVIWAPTGGGFGGKEEFPSVIAIHVALLAMKSGRVVKLIYDRDEDMAATTKRHPSRVRHRTGLDADGRLVAQDIEVVLDGGAYQTLSPVVLSRGIIHAAGPYACDNVRITGEAVLTNTVPYGAFRGFGAPQTQYANERHMDVVARAAGLDPVELRRRNLIRDGQETSTGQVIDDGTDRVAVMDLALERAEYDERRAAGGAPGVQRDAPVSAPRHGSGDLLPWGRFYRRGRGLPGLACRRCRIARRSRRDPLGLNRDGARGANGVHADRCGAARLPAHGSRGGGSGYSPRTR
ncbi:MAG: molybdopterin-dependent oxidoreductase [Acidobacteria bacterium]|nr:molybdopterin-dependent oxidoreductase [Acidobacteriota bacterium]